MLQAHQLDELICLVAVLDRPTLIRHIRNYRASFPVDFTDDFLETSSIERVRHIFVALCLQAQYLPATAPAPMPTAA